MRIKGEVSDDLLKNSIMLSNEELEWKEGLILLLAASGLPFTVMEGDGVKTLEKMRSHYERSGGLQVRVNELYLDLFLNLLCYAFQYKNKTAFEWLLMEILEGNDLFEPSCKIWDLVESNHWPEGFELMVKCITRSKNASNADQLYQLPKLRTALKEKQCFPFKVDPKNDFNKLDKFFRCNWEHPVSKLEWCKKIIPDFISILQNTRNPFSGGIALYMFFNSYLDEVFFIDLISEYPGLLDMQDNKGCSVLWSVLLNNNLRNPQQVLSFNTRPEIIAGIDLHGISVESTVSTLNKVLIDNYIIQSLEFTAFGKSKMVDHYNTYGQIPAYFLYLERNRLLLLLLLSMNDRGCLFSSLNLDLIKIITNQLIGLIKLAPPLSAPFLSCLSPYLISNYENRMNDANWRQLYPQKDSKALFNMLTTEWKHPVPLMKWFKDNIEGFREILMDPRFNASEALLGKLLRATNFNKELFQNIVKEMPELLDITNRKGRSVTWILLKNHSHNPELLEFVLSHKKDPDEIAGIYFADNLDIKEGYSLLNNLLAHHCGIQSLCFTESTKKRMVENFKITKNIPLFFNYLDRNRLLLFLLLCTNDKSSRFLAPLNLDVIKTILKILIELAPQDVKPLLPATNLGFFKSYEKIHPGDDREASALSNLK